MKKTSGKIALIAMMLFLCVNFKNDLYASGGESAPPPPPPNAEVIRKSPIPLKTDGKLIVSEDMIKCTQWEEFNEVKDSKLYKSGGYIEGSVDPYIEADECIEGVLGGNDTKLYENNLLIESNGTYDKNAQVSKTTNQKMPEVFCSKKYSKIHYGQPYERICASYIYFEKTAPTCSDNDVKEYGCKKGEQYCTKCVETESYQSCSGGESDHDGSASCSTYTRCVKYKAIPPITKSVKFNSKRCVKWELAYPFGKATIDPNNIEF